MADTAKKLILHAVLSLSLFACNRRGVEVDGPRDSGAKPRAEHPATEGSGGQVPADPVAWLRSRVPSFDPPEDLEFDKLAIPSHPSEVAPTPSKPLISGAPVLDETPRLDLALPFPAGTIDEACARADLVAGSLVAMQWMLKGPYGPTLSWTDADADGRIEQIARYGYDALGRLTSVTREYREMDDPCDWRVGRERLEYDERGSLVRHSLDDPPEGIRFAANDARLYDDQGRVRWIHTFLSSPPSSIRVEWEGDRVVSVESFDANGRWRYSKVATWSGEDHVRVDRFEADGASWRWDRAEVFARRQAEFVVLLLLTGDIEAPTLVRETVFEADVQITRRYDMRDGALQTVSTRAADGSVEVEAPDQHGALTVRGQNAWIEPGKYRVENGEHESIFQTDCPNLARPDLPPFPDPSKCPPVPAAKPIYGPDDSDR